MAVSYGEAARRLVFECLATPLNNGYRKNLARSLATVAFLYAKSRRAAPVQLDLSGEALCFGYFKNELSAIDKAVKLHPGWRKVPVSLHRLTGLDWREVFGPAPRMLPKFLGEIAGIGGWQALRDFAYPFVGLLIMNYLQPRFAALRAPLPLIVTTNLVHPLSVGVHLAALGAGLPTAFWEHAMTPRMIAGDLGFSRYFVNCSHTRDAFIDANVPATAVELIEAAVEVVPVSLGEVASKRRIGVSVNDLDALADVERTVRRVCGLGHTVVLRVHDSDQRFRHLAKIAARHGVALSNAARSGIQQFVTEVDLVVAGNSNVVLDCLRARKPVIYFWPGESRLFDYYGVVRAAGCASATSYAELSALLGGGSSN
jgi:hypothetical protein